MFIRALNFEVFGRRGRGGLKMMWKRQCGKYIEQIGRNQEHTTDRDILICVNHFLVRFTHINAYVKYIYLYVIEHCASKVRLLSCIYTACNKS